MHRSSRKDVLAVAEYLVKYKLHAKLGSSYADRPCYVLDYNAMYGGYMLEYITHGWGHTAIWRTAP